MKREQRIGSIGQEHAAAALRRLGIQMVEKIGTPVRLIPVARAGKTTPGVFRVIWDEVVSGDHRGILPNGKSVLAETKTIFERNLVWSDLREHQPDRLSEHASHGGLSLLVWVSDRGVFILKWPVPGFGPGKGITLAQAETLDLTTLHGL